LNELHDALKKLARISRVDDEHFQKSLRRKDEDGVRSASADVSHNLMIRANDNMKFELKRVTYTLQKFKRDDIVKDISRINILLRNTLADQDSISQEDDFALGLTRRTVPRQYKKLLRFWKHADCIYRLMQSAWRCACAPLHCVYLHLDQCNVRTDIGLDMLVNFCHEGASQEPRPWDKFSLSVAYSEAQQPQHSPLQRSRPLLVRFDLPSAANASNISSSSTASSAALCTPCTAPACPTPLDATNDDLCLLAKKSQAMFPGSYICALDDAMTNEAYGVFRADTPSDVPRAYSLADILRNRYPVKLFYRHRLSLAYNIAHAFFKLCATPWLDENGLSSTIYLPVSSDGHTLLHGKAFLMSDFHHVQQPHPNNDMFGPLGILLLELCFSEPLERHPTWQKYQMVPDAASDPDLRRTVAMAWAKDVKGEWSSEGSQAINWCLQSDLSQNDSWREAFACNVMRPLRSLCTKAGLGVDGRSDVFHYQ